MVDEKTSLNYDSNTKCEFQFPEGGQHGLIGATVQTVVILVIERAQIRRYQPTAKDLEVRQCFVTMHHQVDINFYFK